MVENNDLKSENTMNSSNVKVITDNKRLLEETTFTIQEEIKSSFEHLINALKSREKQLLRQVEAIHVQQLSLIQQSNLEVTSCKPLLKLDLTSRYDLETQISHLGKLEVFGKNSMNVKDTEPYRVQEYQDANKDHESFNKSIKFEEKGNPIELGAESEANVTIFDDNTPIRGNGILSCSCISSLDSENRSNQELNTLSISNCAIIEKELFLPENESSIIAKELLDPGNESLIEKELFFPKNESFIESESIENFTIIEKESFVTKNESLIEAELNSTRPNVILLELENKNLKIGFSTDEKAFVDLNESYLNNAKCKEVTNTTFHKDINANKEQDLFNLASKNRQIRRDSGEHPKQIQQWLQQILVETETEPMIHEIEQFSEISKARLSGQFPLET